MNIVCYFQIQCQYPLSSIHFILLYQKQLTLYQAILTILLGSKSKKPYNISQEEVKQVIYRGYYMVARRYEFYVRVARTISHEWAKRTSEILFLPREHKTHIFEPTCNVLFIMWRNQFNKSKRRESWRHWTIRHSQRWHTENTPLGSQMKWRMESTSGLVPSKTLSFI